MSLALSPLIGSLYVALGGAGGALARFWLGKALPVTLAGFPWATLCANLIGSLAIGLLVGWIARSGTSGESLWLLLGVGLLGGFTTFSAFSLELAMMIERGSVLPAFLYASVSVLAGVGALFIGLAVMKVAT